MDDIVNWKLAAFLRGMGRAFDLSGSGYRQPPKASEARLGWGWDWQTTESLRHLREDEDRRDGRS